MAKKEIVHYEPISDYFACGIYCYDYRGVYRGISFNKRRVTCKRCRRTRAFKNG